MKTLRLSMIAALAAGVLALSALPAAASHSWADYHWARTSNPFSIKIIDSMTSNWDARLATVNSDWNKSTVMDNVVEAGSDAMSTRKKCSAVLGKIRSCNAEYGFNGWLGLATIWINSGHHIVQGVAKMNDTYFNKTVTYNSEEARRHVACQEIGHLFGLGHQTGVSCMNDRDGINDPAYISPDTHDYDQLVTIYGGHTDSATTIASAASAPAPGPGRVTTYTWIFWARR